MGLGQNGVVLALQLLFFELWLYQNDVVLDCSSSKRRRFEAAFTYPKRRRFGLVTTYSKRRRFGPEIPKGRRFVMYFFKKKKKRRRFTSPQCPNRGTCFSFQFVARGGEDRVGRSFGKKISHDVRASGDGR